MKKNVIYFICCSVFLVSTSSFAASISKGIKEGNSLYDEKKYGEAIGKYNEAKTESPDSDIVNFNLGAAQYKNGNYQEAVDSFTKALNTDNQGIESKAIYNIANAKYKFGSQNIDTDLNSAIGLYKESLDYYKRAMDLDEDGKDAKYNHELVEKELKILLEKQQNQQQQNQDRKDQDNKQDKEDARDRQQSQPQSDNDKKEDARQQAESEERSTDQKGDEDKRVEEEKGGEKDSGSEQEGSYEEAEKMSPEEARMLLEAHGEDEEKENEKKKKRGYYPGVLKDW